MDDLISKNQSLVEWKEDFKSFVECLDIPRDDYKGIMAYIDEVPSAEPERLTDDDFETIRIHLNAYKENLCNQQRWEEAEEYQRIIDRFMAFASAQPDSQPTCDNLAIDTISRQAAIDALRMDISIIPYAKAREYVRAAIETIYNRLEELPSAQPEQWETCFDCPLSHGCPVINGCTNEQAMKYAGEIPGSCPLNTKIERKKGKWIAYGDIPKTCPYCHEDWDKYVFGDIWYSGELPNYCPNCGEVVRGGEQE